MTWFLEFPPKPVFIMPATGAPGGRYCAEKGNLVRQSEGAGREDNAREECHLRRRHGRSGMDEYSRIVIRGVRL